MREPGRVDAPGLLVVAALALALWLPRLSGPIDLRWDGGAYFTLGTALANGVGYRLLNEPGDIAANQYPPGYAVWIAAHEWFVGSADPFEVGHWLRLSACTLFVAYACAIYALLRRRVPRRWAWPGTAICILNLHTYFMSDLCFPEIGYALATVAFFILQDREPGKDDSMLAIAIAWLAFSLRSVGTGLLAAWVGESVLEGRARRAVVRFGIALVPIVAWQLFVASVERSDEYRHPAYAYQRADYLFYNVSYARNVFALKDGFRPELGPASLSDIGDRVVANVRVIPVSLGEAVSTIERVWSLEWDEARRRAGAEWLPASVPHWTVLGLGCIVITSLAVQSWRGRWLAPLYVLACVALACLTPWPGQFARYAVPLAPLLSLAIVEAVAAAERRFPVPVRVVAAAVFGLVLVQQVVTLGITYARWHRDVDLVDRAGSRRSFRLFFYHDAYRVLDQALDHVRTIAAPDDVIAVSMPHWTYLRTGLDSVMPPFETDPAVAQLLLDDVPVRFLVLDLGLAVDSWRYTSAVVAAFPERWERVYAAPVRDESGRLEERELQVYRRTDRSAPSGSTTNSRSSAFRPTSSIRAPFAASSARSHPIRQISP